MAIPRPPEIVSAALAYGLTYGGQGVLGNYMPPEGEKVVPMQFAFDVNAIWEVDLSIALNVNSLSQFRSIYVDATNSDKDCVIYFPLTGMELKVKAGYSEFFPLVNFRYNFKFYVSLDGQGLDAVDLINVYACNFMLPSFGTFRKFLKYPAWLGASSGDGLSSLTVNSAATFETNDIEPILIGSNFLLCGLIFDGAYRFRAEKYNEKDDPEFLSATDDSTYLSGSTASIEFVGNKLSPDNRYIALAACNASGDNWICVYDIVADVFTNILTYAENTSYKKGLLIWLDATHFCTSEVVNIPHPSAIYNYGVRVFELSGGAIIDKGFFTTWGNSINISTALYADIGLLERNGGGAFVVANVFTSSYWSGFQGIYSKAFYWNGAGLTLYSAQLISATDYRGIGSGGNWIFPKLSTNEYALVYGTEIDISLISFALGDGTSSVTRPWLYYETGYVEDGRSCILTGGKLYIVRRDSGNNFYWVYSFKVGASAFTLDWVQKVVNYFSLATITFNTKKIAANKILLTGLKGFANNVRQIGIIQLF